MAAGDSLPLLWRYLQGYFNVSHFTSIMRMFLHDSQAHAAARGILHDPKRCE